MHAPPGKRLVPALGAGTPAEMDSDLFETLDELAREDPSRSWTSASLGSPHEFTHCIPTFPVFVRVVALQHALVYVTAFLDHELVEGIREVTCRDPPDEHLEIWLRSMQQQLGV